MLLARYEDSRRCCEEAIAIARLVHARAEEGHALNTLGCDLAYLGDVDTAVSHLEAARSIAEEVGDLDDLFRAYLNLSDLLIGPVTRVEEGLALALEGVERSTQKGMAGDYGVSLQSNAATALVQLGRFDEADEILGAARRRNPSEMAAIDLHRCWARVELCRGRFEQAATHVGLVHQLMVKTVDPPYRAPLRAIEAELALWQGCLAEAHRAVSDGLRELDGAEDLWLAAPLLWCGIRAQAELALAQRGGQGSKEAQDPTLAAADLLERSRRLCSGATSVAPATRGYLSLCEAEAKRLTRADESGAWETAAAGWAALHQPYLETYARWREAEALLAQRQTRRGAHALERAERSAAQIGAEALLTEVRALARRARVELPLRQPATAATSPAPRPARDGRAGLTARQLEVLELVAAGMTNREIAQRLFITEKTAGAHVSSILATLRVRSRVEAATAAHRMGLTSGNSVG
jgi:DNA-binding CsgD family transcriptional regulator